jgi:DNA-3-methyladenine glycosylase
MYGEPGHAYVYFTYGNHFMLNITTQKTGTPGAVLIRGVEPIEGIALMRRFRPNVPDVQLTSGPGKLTKALNVDKSLNEQDMTVNGPLYVTHGGRVDFEAWCSERIGIGNLSHKLWRFYIKGNSYVSRRRGVREAKLHR